jgi:hypothetical protein
MYRLKDNIRRTIKSFIETKDLKKQTLKNDFNKIKSQEKLQNSSIIDSELMMENS